METTDFKNLYKKIIDKAWEDENFKNELIVHPLKTLNQFTKRELDFGGKNLIIEDQTDCNTIYLNIPPKMDFENIELSEEQLEKIAGGGFFDFFLEIFMGKV